VTVDHGLSLDPLHCLTLGDVLRERRRSYPRHTAVVCGADRFSYAVLDERVTRLANVLDSRGVGQGDRVVWLGQNCHRFLETLLAAAKLGAVFVPWNWHQTRSELAFTLEDSGPRAVIWQAAGVGETIRAARELRTSDATWIQQDGDYDALLEASSTQDQDVIVDPNSAVLLLYTAAFGGRPNGALHSHTGIILSSLVQTMLRELTSDYVYLNCGPLFHVGTLPSTIATLLVAGLNVFTPKPNAARICELINRERCQGAFIVEPTISEMIELNRDGRFDLTSLRTIGGKPEWSAMTSLDESPWARHPSGYGQTELFGVGTAQAFGGEGKHGRPSPILQLRILGPDGCELPPGEIGEIAVRGPTVSLGYHWRDSMNADRQRDRWYHTNDLARREMDGSLTFVGSKERLIKIGPTNIYPIEIEQCLGTHPAVAESGVIGVPDIDRGQAVKAVVVLATGCSATAADLIEHCAHTLAEYKVPRFVEFAQRLPRRGAAIDYAALDQEFGGGGYPGTSHVRQRFSDVEL
jgi:long-chain acyl-CoA synthetase